MTELTQEYVQSLFDYKNGFLYWKKLTSKYSSIKIGDKAGSLHHTGYYVITINGKDYGLHRIIYLYYYGFIPKEIDHIDGNRSNSKIENLREVTRQQNCMNKKSSENSISKYKGVTYHKRDKIWYAQISINGKNQYLGSFNDEWCAAFIYNIYARGLFGKYAYLNNLGDD